MQIRLNGQQHELEAQVTVAALVGLLALPSEAVAVEVNRRIVPRSTYDTRVLAENDAVEIVTFVGGG